MSGACTSSVLCAAVLCAAVAVPGRAVPCLCRHVHLSYPQKILYSPPQPPFYPPTEAVPPKRATVRSVEECATFVKSTGYPSWAYLSHLASRNTQHATRNTQHTTRNTRHATQHIPVTTHHNTTQTQTQTHHTHSLTQLNRRTGWTPRTWGWWLGPT